MPPFSPKNPSDAGRGLFKTEPKKSKIKEVKKAPPMAIRMSEYGRYQIKSGMIAGVCTARAFAKPPTKARGLIAEATGDTEDAAVAALHAAIDAREDHRTQERRTDPHTGSPVPSTEEYMEAMNHAVLTRPQLAMLMALSVADVDGLSEAKVAYAGSYKTETSANKALASVGRMIAGYLSSQADAATPAPSADGSALIGYRGPCDQDETRIKWTLHPELCAAMRDAK